jgi:glyoxylase-like metal-dependent hydrolase (beta-lactamase superfamily II)
MSQAKEDKFSASFYRTKIGDIRAISLHDGFFTRDRDDKFVTNASLLDVDEAFSAIGQKQGLLTLTFTALAIETQDGLTLIDTGFGDNGPPTTGQLQKNLKAAGYLPKDVNTILISHFHGDHINGLVSKSGEIMYPNAKILVPQPEWDFWMNDEIMENSPAGLKPNFELCRRIFSVLKNKVSMFNWDDEISPNVKAICATGHTPGQTAFEINSDGDKLIYIADVTNNPYIFARHPLWKAAFDVNADDAIATRLKILGDASDKNTRLAFYHAPFPGIGYVSRANESFLFIPQIWGAD